MFYAQTRQPERPRKLPWFGRWSNSLIAFFNSLFLVLGLGLVVLGATMQALNTTLARDEVTAIFNEMQFNGVLKIGNVLNSLPVLTICVGGIVFALGIFLCVGKSKQNRICLTLFSIFTLWFLLIQILTCAAWVIMRDKFENNVKSEMKVNFQSYQGVDVTNVPTSTGWDLLHLGFKCCSAEAISGVSSSYSNEFNVTDWWGNRDSVLDLVPTSCCSEATESNYKAYTDSDCERILKTHNKLSCYDEIVKWLQNFWKPAIAVTAILIAFATLLLLLSCVLCCAIGRMQKIK